MHYIQHGWSMSEHFPRMYTYDQLLIKAAGKILHRAGNPFCHGLRKNLPSESQAVAQNIGRQQGNWTMIQTESSPGLFASLRRRSLPAARKILPGSSLLAG